MNINITKITETLDRLDELYNEETDKSEVDNFQLSIYCKVAALELCSWLEETHDELIRFTLTENGVQEEFVDNFDKCFIKKIIGLSYTEHLRLLIINSFGFIKLVKLESEIEEIITLKSMLNELHKYRNHLAHNQYIDFNGRNPINSQKSIDTPSTIKNKLNTLHPILQKIANYLIQNNS